jgi:hypothetical protein
MLTIPLAINAASMSAAAYMAFGWRPPEPKRVRLFCYQLERPEPGVKRHLVRGLRSAPTAVFAGMGCPTLLPGVSNPHRTRGRAFDPCENFFGRKGCADLRS